jgi:hypothetical protein
VTRIVTGGSGTRSNYLVMLVACFLVGRFLM